MGLGKAASALFEELASSRKIFTELLTDAIKVGDKETEIAARQELKNLQKIEKDNRTNLPVPTGDAGKSVESIGLPKGSEADYFGKQIEQIKNRADNLAENTRRNRVEAIRRGYSQGTDKTPIELPGTPETRLALREKAVEPDEVMEPLRQRLSKDSEPDVIDIKPEPEAIEPDEVIEPLRQRLLKAPESDVIDIKAEPQLALPSGKAEAVDQVSKPNDYKTALRWAKDASLVAGLGALSADRGGAGGTPPSATPLADKIANVPQAKQITKEEVKGQPAPGSKAAPSPVTAVKSITEGQTAKKDTDDFSTELDDLKTRITKATATRDEERKRADIGQLAERLGQALAQIGAAQAGMRSGVDLSNITKGLPTIDWEAKRKEAADDYKTELADIGEERRTLQQKLEKAQDKEQRERFHQDDLALKNKEAIATQAYRDRSLGIAAMNAQTQKEAVQLRGGAAAAKEAAKAEAASGKATASQVAALNELNAAIEAGDEKASSVALGKLPIDMQERINKAGGFFGKPKAAQIKEEVGGLSKPSTPAAPAAPGGQDPQVAAFAKQYQLDYNKAKDILVKRGYTPKE